MLLKSLEARLLFLLLQLPVLWYLWILRLFQSMAKLQAL